MIVLAAVIPAMALMLLLGMAQLEARLLRPDRTGTRPPHRPTASLPSRPPVIQQLALPRPKSQAGERALGRYGVTMPDAKSPGRE